MIHRHQVVVGWTEPGQANGHHGGGKHRRPISLGESGQILESAPQGLTIVNSRTDHHLGMDLEPALGEPTQLVEQEGCTRVDQQTAAQLGVGGMY